MGLMCVALSLVANVAGLREGGAFLLTRCKYNKVFNKDKTWWGNFHPRSCETLVICCAICFQGFDFCVWAVGNLFFFWRWEKGGREKLFCRHGFWCWFSGLQMCFFLCGGFLSLVCEQWWKNIVYKRKNISFKRSNMIYNHKNMIYKHENINYKGKNITFGCANIVLWWKNIKTS